MKSIGASQIKRVFLKLHERVINYGTTKNINSQAEDLEKKNKEAKSWIVLLPEDPIRSYWNLIIILLLVYVVVYVPISVTFLSNPSGDTLSTGEIIDITVDIFFGLDILINFISAYEDIQG